jgi:hypothetical protein
MARRSRLRNFAGLSITELELGADLQSGFRVNGCGWALPSVDFVGRDVGPGLRDYSQIQQLKQAAGGGLATDGVEAAGKRLAVYNACRSGSERRASRRDQQAFAAAPGTPGDQARAVIADIFNPGAFRVARFAKKLKQAEICDQDSGFPAASVHDFFPSRDGRFSKSFALSCACARTGTPGAINQSATLVDLRTF